MVRSEGGEDGSNFNNLPRRAKATVHFRPIGVFAAPRQEQQESAPPYPVGSIGRRQIVDLSKREFFFIPCDPCVPNAVNIS